MENEYKIVEFEKYCDTCKHKDVASKDEPCYECLDNPVNLNSHKPVKWEESDKNKSKEAKNG